MQRSFVFVVFVAVSLGACGGGGGGESDVVLRGSVEKGPYVLGSTVELSPVSAIGDPTGSVFSTKTMNDLGEFSTTVSGGAVALSITGSGFYYNEVAGRLSNASLTLRAYYEPTGAEEEHANLNVVTHLSYDRVHELVVGGASFAEAIAQAETELRVALALVPPAFDPGAEGTAMSVAGGDTDANAYLLAVSALFAEAAQLRAGPGGPVDATLQEIMNQAAFDLADDGALSGNLSAELAVARRLLNPRQIMDDLAARLMSIGSTATVPDLNAVLDQDQDGEANADDCRPLDPDRSSTNPDFDNDGDPHIDCGGTDCDDDCPTCHAGGTAMCGEARDHDCDGQIDDVEGCASCAPVSPSVVGGPVATGTVQSLFVRGDYAYITNGNGVTVLDVSVPSAPTIVGSSIATGASARVAWAWGDALVVSADGQGSGPSLYVFSLTDPSAPTQEGTLASSTLLDNMALTSSGLALAASDGLHVIDVSDPAIPYEASVTPVDVFQIAASGSFAYLAGSDAKFRVVSLADPFAPQVVHVETGPAVRQLAVSGNRLLLATGAGIEIWDISTPSSPSLTASVPVAPFGVNNMVVAGDWVYVDGESGIDSINVATPSTPVTGPSVNLGFYSLPLLVIGNHLYAEGANGEGFYIIDLGCV